MSRPRAMSAEKMKCLVAFLVVMEDGVLDKSPNEILNLFFKYVAPEDNSHETYKQLEQFGHQDKFNKWLRTWMPNEKI